MQCFKIVAYERMIIIIIITVIADLHAHLSESKY